MRPRGPAGTCSVKWSSRLQETDSLRGSSSLVRSAQGGRGLSSTHSSDWSTDRRRICRSSCRTESCTCSLTGEQQSGQVQPGHMTSPQDSPVLNPLLSRHLTERLLQLCPQLGHLMVT